ncbi:MAG TPA: KH domain-containing protein [Patescibacteria group bacterium]|nr:KH domain-containing protein [Patescibacteria group bacterium]
MRELLEFIIGNILGKTAKFEVTEEDNDSVVTLTVKTEEKDGGLIIGKQGKVIKAIRNILRIKATLEKKKIILLVNPNSN